MLRSVGQWIAFFLLTTGLLVGCQAMRSAPAIDLGEPELATGVLTSRQVSSLPFVWWEAEQPTATSFPTTDRNPFAPANATQADVLSGGQWMGVDGARNVPLFLEYQVQVPQSQAYFFYGRKFWQHGPFRWRWDNQPWQVVDSNVYLLDSVMLRQFVSINWVSLGKVPLTKGTHTLRLELTRNDGAAAFDCFVLTQERFQPRGKLKPDRRYAASIPGWFVFDPELDSFKPTPIDLRSLNESVAGEHGLIQVEGETFVHAKTGQSVRFWAINTGGETLQMSNEAMAYLARSLAKRGVNLVRLHSSLWGDDFGKILPYKQERLFAFVSALKQEGIYLCLSIYFPLWLQLQPNSGFAGYTGQTPFALLFFNREFQQLYYGWWRSLLTTTNPLTGKALRDDPALAMVELVNEDSYFFWTFDPYKNVPAPQMEQLETQFGTWLTAKYGSLDKAMAGWSGYALHSERGDRPERGRLGLPSAGELAVQKKSRRAQDAATFLMESQRQFFQEAITVLRQKLGYQGLIYASNWTTADAQTLGPLDKYSNTIADFMDRHGYFSGAHEGTAAGYALNPGDTYRDRSALLFTDADQKPDFNLPQMDIRYNGLPSTITEINWTMPNRFRADFPLLTAAYGSLQGSDGVFFFSLDKIWEPSLNKFSVASPVTLGQFPATALIYRQGLLKEGEIVVDVPLKLNDLLSLKGAPLNTPQNLDAFRAQNIPPGEVLQSDRVDGIDPLATLVGKVNLRFVTEGRPAQLTELSRYIDREHRTVRSSTGQLLWDYRKGLVTVNAPYVQGITGFLRSAGQVTLTDAVLSAAMPYGTMLLVALDQQPIAQSGQLLLQVSSEEQNFGWRTSGYPQKTIEQVGNPPITVRNLAGKVMLRRPDAASLTVTALDANGYPSAKVSSADNFNLRHDALYYLIKR